MGQGEIDDNPSHHPPPHGGRFPKPAGRTLPGVSSGFVWSSLLAAIKRGEPVTHEPTRASIAAGVRRLG